MFIVFEGIDGTGKTTIIKKLSVELNNVGYEIFVTQEPSQTWLGQAVRRAIAEEKNGFTQALLFFADRAEHMTELRENENKIVLCDRYIYSTFAYQGAQLEAAMGLENAITWFEGIYAPTRIDPDIVFLITVDPVQGIRRIHNRDKKEKFERVEFLKRVQEIYLEIAESYNFIVIDGNRELKEVYEEIKNKIINIIQGK